MNEDIKQVQAQDGDAAAIRHLNGVNISKMAIRPSVIIPAMVVPNPQQSFQLIFITCNA